MSQSWLVLKFGGTSVAGEPQWSGIAKLARSRMDSGYRVVLVCSAVAGVTNALQRLADSASVADKTHIESIIAPNRALARSLNVSADDLLEHSAIEIGGLSAVISSTDSAADRYSAIADLLSIGEWLCTRIGERYLATLLAVKWADVRQALKALAEPDGSVKRSRLLARCESGPDKDLQNTWRQEVPVIITQGFVASHPEGGSALLGRGGSDTSAALLASRLKAEHVEIWTDIPGLFSADPRVLSEAKLLRRVNYQEALEMAASGARVVHPRCIRVAADSEIPILVRDLSQPDFEGTCIDSDDQHGTQVLEGIRGVCHQTGMAVLLLQTLDTREHVGFLAWVFEQFKQSGVSIDLVATSETTTTVAINRNRNQLDTQSLENLTDELRARCAVTVFPNCSGINLVGRGARVALADIDSTGTFFKNHPLLMVSQSANDLCISLLLHTADAETMLPLLHNALIGKGLDDQQKQSVFGPDWQEIRGLYDHSG